MHSFCVINHFNKLISTIFGSILASILTLTFRNKVIGGSDSIPYEDTSR